MASVLRSSSAEVRPWLNWPWQVRWTVLVTYMGFVTWVSLSPAETFAQIPAVIRQQSKAVHFLLYGLLVSLARWAMAVHWNLRPAFLVVVLGASAYGTCMELLQGALVRYHRTFEFGDIIANSLGALCFWWLSRWMFVPACAAPRFLAVAPEPKLPLHLKCVSVVLPVRNEAVFIENTLRAVLAQDYPANQMEVLLVDGMSDDGTREVVKRLAEEDARLRLLDNPRRIIPAALNLGIRAARGDIIVRVDGHACIPQDYVRECVACLEAEEGNRNSEIRSTSINDDEKGTRSFSRVPTGPLPETTTSNQDSDPEQVGTQSEMPRTSPALIAVGGAWDCVGKGRWGEAIALAIGSRFGAGNAQYRTCGGARSPLETDTVPFWAIRRRAFGEIGLFREEMLCHEDYEFNHRCRQAGGRVLLLPWLRAQYHVRPTLAKLARQYWNYGVWKGRFLRSHPESLKIRHLAPPLLVAALMLGCAALCLHPAGAIPLGILAGLYGAFLLTATTILAQGGHGKQALLLPVVLATLHGCWGTGVWVGLLRGPVPGEPPKLAT